MIIGLIVIDKCCGVALLWIARNYKLIHFSSPEITSPSYTSTTLGCKHPLDFLLPVSVMRNGGPSACHHLRDDPALFSLGGYKTLRSSSRFGGNDRVY